MRYPPGLLDEIRARLPVSHVVGRRVQLKRKGREFVGLSPFKPEKTPSFTVNDQKGFYHCFSSGEHGDIFKFVMAMEGLSFPEAVERLADEAGVTLPKPDAGMEKREAERERLLAVMEAASRFFEAQLRSGAARTARDYLDGRGIGRDALATFRIGYAPAGRFALKEHLAGEGYSASDVARAGLVVAGDDIAVPYDRFRNRIMFPIEDLRGRVIAFGGRALDPDHPAKYLNSPETPLFHKGSVLYNAARARTPAHEKGTVIATEGYMDVIALAGAGLGHAVAPLGTALTSDQLRILWRMAPEPVLCFDGDEAGRRAAYRALETALGHLTAGYSLRFAFLPTGLDPDDLVRSEGAEAMQGVVANARPLVEVLWAKEWESGDWSTPERRAALEKRLMGLAAQVREPQVRAQYERDLRDRLWRAWRGRAGPVRPTGSRTPAHGRKDGSSRALAGTGGGAARSASLLASGIVQGEESAVPRREAVILQTLLNHPWLIDEECEEIAVLSFTNPSMARLRDGMLMAHAQENPLDSARLRDHLTHLGHDAELRRLAHAMKDMSEGFARPGVAREDVEAGWHHVISMHRRRCELERSLRMAEAAWLAEGSDEALADLNAVWRELNNVGSLESDTSGEGGSEAQRGSGKQHGL